MDRREPETSDRDRLRMVDVGGKPVVERVAVASGEIRLRKETIDMILSNAVEKGNVIVAAKLAGIAAAKRTPDILPLCHPIRLAKVDVDVQVDASNGVVRVSSEVHATERTGVEMEALVATSTALLTIWDMTKMHEKDPDGQYPSTIIGSITVERKRKG